MSMTDKIYHYVKGLPSKIVEDVRRSHPATLEKAVEAAHDATSNLGASIIVPCMSLPTAVAVSVPTQPLAIRPSVHADPTGPAPMDIGAVDSRLQWRRPGRRPQDDTPQQEGHGVNRNLPPFTQRERDVLMEFDGYFNCYTLHAGHTAANCPNRREVQRGQRT
uniref:Uncharacterized protein n=1 Tax=Chromera velia CCMP2878 TaxID=1169474 RepID=A0A0G4HGU7_9ALVE|eukprot:Cvel_27456.t1-p1 / transcript=Cvel_27456.t1 / gene=Cvel_27456 / organism=Chromera_velia_CCMP2878 / gene_product=hypothetical protein / transcript_product=hypothetical protein / location=Cvel_scaffold3428:11083-11568(+) / protein_length=162 / sequence_SO=supercontig / SO=protein_coding / is_pseudo=false